MFQDDIGLGAVVGSAVFNIMLVISVCALFAGMVCKKILVHISYIYRAVYYMISTVHVINMCMYITYFCAAGNYFLLNLYLS